MTAFFAATTALVQNDLKRVIAYSTCSQLGYMVFACGISNYSSSELAKIAGMKSDQFEMILDVNFGDEIVHRDNMVILAGVENGI